MSKYPCQYTIRNIPAAVDRVLRQRARDSGKSFNQVAVEALAIGADQDLKPTRDFRDVVGSMSAKEAAKVDEEIRLQRQIDPKAWRE